MEGYTGDRLQEKCGVSAVFTNNETAARLVYFSLSALQHRGQEAAGIVSSNSDEFFAHGAGGLVSQVFSEAHLSRLNGHMAIGHNRYATSGSKQDGHIQPVLRGDDLIALAHNGNLPSTTKLMKFLKLKKIYKRGSNDSEMMADAIRYYMYHGSSAATAIKKAWPLFTGAFSCVLMDHDGIYAFRDSRGIRPLSVGRLGSGYAIASETCAFDLIGAEFMRDVLPGELVKITGRGLTSYQIEKPDPKLEVFEFIYFARPDSRLLGQTVNEVRRRLGEKLAEESPAKADVVVPVPDSAVPAGLGFARASGIDFDHGLIKNRYVHRTFIHPTQELREQAVRMKVNPLRSTLEGKDVVLVDDSIVRGTTLRQLIGMLRSCNVGKIHVRISCPPIIYPDFYGIDTPDQSKLISSHKTPAEIAQLVGADSLSFLSYEGMIDAIGVSEDMLCTACFSGKYPIDIMERTAEIKSISVMA
ncbi:amidophosphoribosyltransferase [Candidatus Saccharibacteria bacterium]|nr:amidophosphoribosyltransferase [Candidatus Saccharibacteria bacterium]